MSAAETPANAGLKISRVSAHRHTEERAGMKIGLSKLACGFVIVGCLLIGDCRGVERSRDWV